MRYGEPPQSKWDDPNFREDLARGNGIYDAWAGYEPRPDPYPYDEAYRRGYESMLDEVGSGDA